MLRCDDDGCISFDCALRLLIVSLHKLLYKYLLWHKKRHATPLIPCYNTLVGNNQHDRFSLTSIIVLAYHIARYTLAFTLLYIRIDMSYNHVSPQTTG